MPIGVVPRRVKQLSCAGGGTRCGPRFGQRLDWPQALVELSADHSFTVHKQTEGLGNEVVLSRHAPRDRGLAAFGLERQLREVRAFEWLVEIEPEPHPLARDAVCDGHAA